MRRRWVSPATLGLAAAVGATGAGLLTPWGSAAGATGGSGTAYLPSRLPDYSYLTGSVSASAPGRAIAIYQHGFGVEFLDFPQAVTVAADRDATRRIGLAEDRGGPQAQGDAGPMLLSPDGSRVAVGTYDAEFPDLALLDLSTGEVTSHPVEGGRSAVPIAWSPDSVQIAYLTTSEAANPHTFDMRVGGSLGVLDLASGASIQHQAEGTVWAAAYSPDGTELAVQRGGSLEVVAPDGSLLREIDTAPGSRLDGPHAWSADGALLATTTGPVDCFDADRPFDYAAHYACQQERDHTRFVDASGLGGAVPQPLSVATSGGYGVLGWTGDRELLVLDDLHARHDPEDDSILYWVTAVSLDDGATRRISAVDGETNFGIGQFQLATGLLPDIEVREPGPVDRGRWPALAIGGAAVLTGLMVFLVAHGLVRVARVRHALGRGGPGRA